MKQIQIDPDIQDWLRCPRGARGDDSATLRRELDIQGPGGVVNWTTTCMHFLVARIRMIGESASTIIRRERDGQAGPVPPEHFVEFHLPDGTGNAPWNTRESAVVATVGDTLRIVNDDEVPHRPHTSGVPFPHAQADITPGQSANFALTATLTPSPMARSRIHDFGPGALFWIEVRPAQ